MLNFVTNTRTKENYLKYEQIGGNKEMKNNKHMTKKQEQLLNKIFNHIQSSDYNPKEYSDQLLDTKTLWKNNTITCNCEDEMPYIENNHIIYVLLHSKGRRACLLLSLDQTIFYHSQSPGFNEDVTFIMTDYAAELTKNYQGQMIHEKHTYYKHNPDYKITYGIGTIIQREKHGYNQKISIFTVYYNEPLERIFKIPLEKMPPLQRRKHKNVD